METLTRAPAVRWLFEDRTTGKLVVWQTPNAPLALWLVLRVVQLFVDATWLTVLAGIALAVWAVLEVARGVNPFRRILGGVVLAFLVAGLLR